MIDTKKFKLIGCFDGDPILIYKVETGVYVSINMDEYEDDEFEQRFKAMSNWISPMRFYDIGILFFETSPYDAQARHIIEQHSSYVEEQIARVKSHGKPDRKMIREMGNIVKKAKPNEIVY